MSVPARAENLSAQKWQEPFLGVNAICTERKKIAMPDQPENEKQQSETVTSQELLEVLLAELDASQQVITTLSDERLEEIVGGGKINLSSIKKNYLDVSHAVASSRLLSL